MVKGQISYTTNLLGMTLTFLWIVLSTTVNAEDMADLAKFSTKEDYITCWKQPCVRVAGSEWSEKNPNGVAVSVRMGSQPAATDDQIKMVLTRDLNHYGVKNIKFFYEQNDAVASGICLHVRGGTEGVFMISNVREELEAVAKRALNTNPLFLPD